jgi:isoprenylcysteine carboxyl methyltransferase (ICMT) family protein YpbQ
MASPYGEIIVACMIVLGAYFILTARPIKSTKRADSTTGNLVRNGLMLLGFVCAWPTLRSSTLGARFVPATPALETIGVLLVAAGAGFAIWSRHVLGANWSAAVTIKEEHRLIRRGPYAIVRNPIYTGDIAIVVGMALAVGEIRGLVGVALMVGAVWHKGRTEERFLLAEFGDEYADYQREVRFLLPFVA